jgi:phage tail sheath gpL-like
MTLSGVDPNDPTPSVKRELIFGAGSGSSGVTRDVVIYGNATAAGSEVDNELNGPIADDQDCRDRFGERSELYGMYRKFVDIDSSATIYGIAVPDPAGTAAAAVVTVATVSDANSIITVTILGEDITVPVAVGDAVADVGDAIEAAILAYDEGRLPVTANNVAGAVTITAANTGIRSEFVIAGDSTTRGIRAKIETNGTANAMTCVETTSTGTWPRGTATTAPAATEATLQSLRRTTRSESCSMGSTPRRCRSTPRKSRRSSD